MLNRLTTLLPGKHRPSHDYDTPQLHLDTALKVLSADRRRRVIEYLCTQEAETTVRTLSEYIADQEGTDRKNLYIALHQHHIPTMAEAGVVSWDQQAGTVTATPTCTLLHQANRDLTELLT